jgi:hypothetical protein
MPYKRYEGKTNHVLIAFIGYVNDLDKLQQFKASVQKSHHKLHAALLNKNTKMTSGELHILLSPCEQYSLSFADLGTTLKTKAVKFLQNISTYTPITRHHTPPRLQSSSPSF